MLIVRFSTGLTVTYNDANFLERDGDAWVLLTKLRKDGGVWVATVSAHDCVVEAVRPCRVDWINRDLSPDAAARLVLERPRQVSRDLVAELKALLKGFNAKSWRWTGVD